MRDKYFNRLGCMRLPLAERGMVATLWSVGDQIMAPFEDVDAVMGNGWKPIADRLALLGVVEMECRSGWVHLKLVHPNEKRRLDRKIYQQKRGKK